MTVTAERPVYVIRAYVSNEASASGVELLEEHEFVSESEARNCARDLVASGAVTVTFNAPADHDSGT